MDLIEVVQPALWAVMVSLARLWQHHGIQPAAVVGHSQGEIAAAHIVGGLSLDDAARIVAVRSRALARLAGAGGMLAVRLSLDALDQRVAHMDGRVTVAAVNAPASLVVSGDPAALDELAVGCEADGVDVRRILSTVPGHSPHVEAVREEVLDALAGVTPHASDVPLYSTVTAERIDTTQMDAEYWYRNLRHTVRFHDAIQAIAGDGINTLIEIGPHPVLAAPILETTDDVAVIATLRRDDGGLARFTHALAEAHVSGIDIAWNTLLDTTTTRVALPTYAFQHQHYWLTTTNSGDPSTLGQAAAGHPLLDATIALAAGQGTLHTGRLSLERHPWLADHAVLGTTLLPATAFLELALHAAHECGTPRVDELTLDAPLPLHPDHAVDIQVTVSEPGHDDRRHLTIHSRATGDADWTHHATATLAARTRTPETADIAPAPDDATELDIDDLYDRLEQAGYEYGPAFQAMRRVRRGGDGEIFADVELDDARAEDAGEFLLHPALLDAALQPLLMLASERRPGAPMLVDRWSEVLLHAASPAALSVHARLDGDAADVTLSDADGSLVASLRATLSAAQTGAARISVPRDALLRMAWHELADASVNGAHYALLGSASDLALNLDAHPDVGSLAASIDPAQPGLAAVLADFRASPDGASTGAAARSLLQRALELMQAWLRNERLAGGRLVLVTRGAVAAAESDELPALAAAPLWGLVRSAQSEHPDRFALIDVDGDAASSAAVLAAVASGEPQIAIRHGKILVPRLAQVGRVGSPPALDRLSTGTMLITGGTGGVGAALARHMVRRHGVAHLLLVSRSGRRAPGARELEEELAAAGATVQIAACDISDRAQVEDLLRSVPAERPLAGVIHAAGASDNSLIESMTIEQLDTVLAAKLDGALHLHELTQAHDLDCFVACSSMAATFGGPGQGNYAAANAFLDALAAHRRARGLAATSVAWGLWADTGQGRTLEGRPEQLLRTLSGSGSFRAFSEEVGLELFDGALAAGLPMVLAGPYRLDVLREEIEAATAPRILLGLVRSRPRRVAAYGRAARHRHGAAAGADLQRVVDETRAQIAAALGYESADRLQMQLSFLELGFDSLVSVELRKRLQAVTGLQLPATVMFDHPTPAALVAYLEGQLGGTAGDAQRREPGSPSSGAAPDTITAMFRRAHQLGRLKDGLDLAEAAARLRPRFGVSHVETQAPAVIPLASGERDPILFCIPSLVASGGPHEFARFAKAMQNGREVVVVPAPGFRADELLPSRLEAVAGAQATAIARHAAGRSVAIVGFSTGGLLAHAVAGACARDGVTPTAVVLIDSYTVSTMWRVAEPVFDRMLSGEGSHPAISDATVTAMGTYLSLLSSWTPTGAVAPTLLVRASDPVEGLPRIGDWMATWAAYDALADLPGSHLTLLEDDVETTAAAVEEWLVRQPRAAARSGRRRSLLRHR